MSILADERADVPVMFQRWLTSQLVAQAERSAFDTCRCVYCGFRCLGRTCPSHRDLPRIERELVAS